MLKSTLTALVLLSLLLLGNGSHYAAPPKSPSAETQTETVERMIVDGGNATIAMDLNRLNGSAAATESKLDDVRFTLAQNSYFTVVVTNDVLRASEPGSIGLIPQSATNFPAPLKNSLQHLALTKNESGAAYELAVRDANSGFVFFNVEGHFADYDAANRLFNIHDGRLLLSPEFATALGRTSDTGAPVGKLSMSANMVVIERTRFVDGEATSDIMPSNGTVPGPDVIVGDLNGLSQPDTASAGTQVGLSVGTDSCNAGTIDLDWFQLPNNDHPVIPQNMYRMSGGGTNDERFEQIGQSSVKHAFQALTQNICGYGCNGVGNTRLGSGCSDPYVTSLNSGGTSHDLGSRAWINPFTGSFPRGDSATPPDTHTGHTHNSVSHRMLVEINDLNTTLNSGATYFTEAQYINPHEYVWCQANPGQCNMYNNVSYRQYLVSGTTGPFTFNASTFTTQRMQPAIRAWTGATLNQFEPAPGVDGIGTVGCKVTNPSAGVWHYEYAVYNQNLDRGVQSFTVPLGAGIVISNIGFHAPPQHPGWAADGTVGNTGFSSTPWTVTQTDTSITWNSETFAQNQNANAIRWGTMYNFRFDANRPPTPDKATLGFFKTGSTLQVGTQIPTADTGPTPTPDPNATPTPTPTDTPTPSPSPTPGPTGTPSPVPTASPTPAPTGTPIACAGSLTENFDGVTVPALPTGWTATNASGPAPLWVTSNSGVPAPSSDTAPNAAFVDDPAVVSDKLLDSPPIGVTNPAAQISFRNNYNLETSNGGFFDGGVLEISIGGGAFTDILAAGGSFVAGGYNSTISTAFGSPIGGRPAWGGSSGGFITTTVNVPAAAAGQNIQLRWHMASDTSVSSAGWRIDTVQFFCNGAPSPTPSPIPTVSPTPGPCGGTAFSENFDGVTAPALPTGWTVGNTNGGSLWATSNTTSDTAPNDAFVNDSTAVNDKHLDTPNLTIGINATITFRHTFNLEASGGQFFDGGVLEVSSPNINGGAFTDITNAAVGGSFSVGGYNAILAAGSALAGRNAWSGNSGGYITTTANLGPNVNGQTIKLRFRVATDNGNSSQVSGWRVDTISSAGICVNPGATPAPTPTPTPAPTPPPTVCTLTEGLDNVTTLIPGGWITQNNSQPGPGTTGWFQGATARFASFSGAPTSYVAADFNNGTGTSTLSNWLLTPPVLLQNGATLNFWTRTATPVQFPDRLQVLMSTNGTSGNVGTTSTSVGDFSTLLLDINPTYTLTDYPTAWTQFTVTISGLGSPVKGRLAFRYFAENGGPNGANSFYIGIDSVDYNCAPPTPTPAPSPTDTPTPGPTSTPSPAPTDTPTPTPAPTAIPTVSIAGTATYCVNSDPVPGVTMTLSGGASGSTLSDGSGNYSFSSLVSGMSYSVVPSKADLPAGSAGISTIDALAVQLHYINVTPITGACQLAAADVNGDALINTVDVLAIQRFFIGRTFGTANVGKYRFTPANRTYPSLISDQTGQDYSVIVLGDVASGFVHRANGSAQDASRETPSTVSSVALPNIGANRSRTNFTAPITTTTIDQQEKLVGFQGDYTFDERLVRFENEPVAKAGLTQGNWSVTGNVLAGPGPIRTLRVSAISTDFAPLSGSGVLFELKVKNASPGAQLIPVAASNAFIFIDSNLQTQKPADVTAR